VTHFWNLKVTGFIIAPAGAATVTVIAAATIAAVVQEGNARDRACLTETGNLIQQLSFVSSKGLWRWHSNLDVTVLDIIHRPLFYLKHSIWEIGSCLRLQLQPTRMAYSLSLERRRSWSFCSNNLRSFHLKQEKESVWETSRFNEKTERWQCPEV
jgi:hypothetical protein